MSSASYENTIKKIKARKTLTKMYEGLLIGIRCTCLLNKDGRLLILKNINEILKDAIGEERATRRDFEGCVDNEVHWERLIEKWLK